MRAKDFRLLVAMSWFEAQRFRAYPLEIVANLMARTAETTLFIVFWLLVGKYSSNHSIHPKDVISYYMIINGVLPLFFGNFGIASETLKLIKRGELNQVLLRPVSPLLYPWATRTGRNAVNVLFGLAQVAAGITIAGGVPDRSLPYLAPVLLNALLINWALNICVATFGFYLTEASGVKNACIHVATFCRGGLIPLFLMPAGAVTFLQYTPFPASQYHLAIVLQGARLPEWHFVIIGLAWSVILVFAAVRFWRHGLRKYEAVGI